MRFLLTLGLIISIESGCNILYATDDINLSFSVCLHINGNFEYSDNITQSEELPELLERNVNVQGLNSNQTLNDILMHYLTQGLGLKSIENLSGTVITKVESVPSSLVASPTLSFSKNVERSFASVLAYCVPDDSVTSIRSISPVDKNCSKSSLFEVLVTPPQPDEKEEFIRWNSLLTLKGEALRQVIAGNLLKVSFRSHPAFSFEDIKSSNVEIINVNP